MTNAHRHREASSGRPLAAVLATLSLALAAGCDDNSGKTGSANAPRDSCRYSTPQELIA